MQQRAGIPFGLLNFQNNPLFQTAGKSRFLQIFKSSEKSLANIFDITSANMIKNIRYSSFVK